MGKSKRMKKWGGAYDPNAVPPGNYGANPQPIQQGQVPIQQSQVPGQVPGQVPIQEEKNIVSKGWDSVTSLFGFGSETPATAPVIDPATGLPVTGQAAGGRRRKRSHKKRSRRSKKSRRHR
jgi:hypothetical protein